MQESPEEARRWMTFSVGDEYYAQSIASVKEVIPFMPPVPVPGAPAGVAGVLNVRGEVITVLSGRALLAVTAEAGTTERILVLEAPEERFGVSVDAVCGIVDLDPTQIQAAESPTATDMVIGTANRDDGLIILVELCRAAG